MGLYSPPYAIKIDHSIGVAGQLPSHVCRSPRRCSKRLYAADTDWPGFACNPILVGVPRILTIAQRTSQTRSSSTHSICSQGMNIAGLKTRKRNNSDEPSPESLTVTHRQFQ